MSVHLLIMNHLLSLQDFDRAFDFAIKYHLDPSKSQSSRTSGASRGLGGVLDSFMLGKLVEIGVANILKLYNPTKEYVLDLEIKQNNEVLNEPDIEKIIENDKERKPACFIEIKNISESDRWIGLTLEQYETISRSSSIDSAYIIGAYIRNTNDGNLKQKDLLGIYLKNKFDTNLFNDFTSINNIEIVIEYVVSCKELQDYGRIYKKNTLLYETEIFELAGPQAGSDIIKGKINKIGSLSDGTLDCYQINSEYDSPDFMGPLSFVGNLDLYEKVNLKSVKRFIHCSTDVAVTSSVLGTFYLKSGSLYFLNLGTVGRNPILNRNNIWIAKRSVPFLVQSGKLSSPEKVLREIAQKI